MDFASMVMRGLSFTHERLRLCTADLTDEEAGRVLAGQLTPAVWQLGHVALVDTGHARRSGGAYALPTRYEDVFKIGTGGEAAYPPLAEVWQNFDGAHQAIVKIATTVDLTTPAEGRAYSNVGEMLVQVCIHRSYHIGKLTTLRALLGKRRLFG